MSNFSLLSYPTVLVKIRSRRLLASCLRRAAETFTLTTSFWRSLYGVRGSLLHEPETGVETEKKRPSRL